MSAKRVIVPLLVILALVTVCISTHPNKNNSLGSKHINFSLQSELKHLREINKPNVKIDLATSFELSEKELANIMKADVKNESGHFPVSFGVDKSGNLYFLRQGQKSILKYNKAGKLVDTIVIHKFSPKHLKLDSIGESFFLINCIDNKLLVLDSKGNHLYLGTPPKTLGNINDAFDVFVLDKHTIAFLGMQLDKSVVFTLDKGWKSQFNFTKYGLDNKYYLLGGTKIQVWTKNERFSQAETYFSNSFDYEIGYLIGIAVKGLFYEIREPISSVISRKRPEITIVVKKPYEDNGKTLKLPFGDFLLGYDGNMYVAPIQTPKYKLKKYPIYRIRFL